MVKLRDTELKLFAQQARRRGLDGSDRGAVRRFLWWECVYSDALDDAVTDRVAELISRSRAT
jgi:hypothetical protein